MSRKARKNVGVIGLGIIGTRVAAGLRAAGYQVYVWNRSAKPAPNFLGSPAEVAESAEIIQIFVADAAALFDVVEAMSEVLSSKHVVVCNSTVGPEAVLEAAQLVEARGAQFLDAPFTGSKLAAEKRELVYYVGGPDPAFLRARPILELTSKAILRMGKVGDASIKVVTNMMSAVTVQVLAEALSIVQKAGLEPELLAAAIEQNACRSGVVDLKLPKMMSGDYEPHFSLKHMFKDVQLGIHMANSLDIEIPATTVTAGVMYGALNRGWGEQDFSVLFKNYAPAEASEELPALEHVLHQVEPMGENAFEEGSLNVAEPVIAPGMDEENGERTAPAPLDETPPVHVHVSPSPVVADPPITNNGLVREAVPTEEAARIIEAVLAHVAIQRGDTGTPAREAHGDALKVSEPSLEGHNAGIEEIAKREVESAPAAAVIPPAAAASSHPDSSGAMDQPKPIAEAQPATEASEPVPPPQNFVRRWFVGR